MKKVYAVLALALGSGGTAFAIEEPVKAVQEISSVQAPQTGSLRIRELREGYKSGKFDAFLADLDGEFRELQKSGRVEEFAEMRRVVEADEEIKGLASRFDQKAAVLLQERNSELNDICKGRAKEIAVERVNSVTAPVDEKEKEAIRTLASLRFKTPDSAASADERALIEIDLAYEFKSVHLNLRQMEGQELFEKQIVLGMDKMKRMQQASESFSDAGLKETVVLASAAYDGWQAKSLDMRDLIAAAKKPSNDLDRSIGSVLSGYKAKKDDLYQREFLAKLES